MHSPSSCRAPWRRTLALLATAALLGACGGGDDEEGSGSGGADNTTTTAPAGEPVRGGTLIYAVEADTAAPWLPSAMVCAAACHSTIGRTVFEPLVVVADDGNSYPYLLESIEPNADASEWTLRVRQGIKFHDLTDLNADAVAAHIEATRSSALLATSAGPIREVVSDGAMTVTVRMSQPWPAFATYLNGHLGYVPSPAWTAAVAGRTASATEPVGTGPFKFVSYEAGENGSLRAERFEDYWRGDGPNAVTGEGLPYLDAIEVRFIPDSQARSQALLAGDIDLLQTTNGIEMNDLEAEDGINVSLLDSPYEVETAFRLVNHQAEVGGQPNPLADVRVRRAVAMATDNEVLAETRTGGRHEVANGPFPPGVDGYLEDTDYPGYDPDAARALVEQIEAEKGPLRISLKETTDPFNLTTAELLKDMWEKVGFEVSLDQIPQADFITEALAGNFQIFGWRNHAGVDPDQQWVWWNSANAAGIALNFGRIVDPEVDRLTSEIRTQTDPAARKAAAEDLNRRMGQEVHNIWNYWEAWALAHDDNVFNVVGGTIPGAPRGVRSLNMGMSLPGAVFPGEIFENPAD